MGLMSIDHWTFRGILHTLLFSKASTKGTETQYVSSRVVFILYMCQDGSRVHPLLFLCVQNPIITNHGTVIVQSKIPLPTIQIACLETYIVQQKWDSHSSQDDTTILMIFEFNGWFLGMGVISVVLVCWSGKGWDILADGGSWGSTNL